MVIILQAACGTNVKIVFSDKTKLPPKIVAQQIFLHLLLKLYFL